MKHRLIHRGALSLLIRHPKLQKNHLLMMAAAAVVTEYPNFETTIGRQLTPADKAAIAHCLFGASNVAMASRQYGDAIAYLTNLLRLRPGHPDARFSLAHAYTAVGDLKNAHGEYRALIRTYPQFLEAKFSFAQSLLQMGTVESRQEAVEQLDSVRFFFCF
jgi:tetratricopeptide (TPR) repeat protein